MHDMCLTECLKQTMLCSSFDKLKWYEPCINHYRLKCNSNFDRLGTAQGYVMWFIWQNKWYEAMHRPLQFSKLKTSTLLFELWLTSKLVQKIVCNLVGILYLKSHLILFPIHNLSVSCRSCLWFLINLNYDCCKWCVNK